MQITLVSNSAPHVGMALVLTLLNHFKIAT